MLVTIISTVIGTVAVQTVKKVLQVLVTIISTVIGTVAVQASVL